MAFINWSDELSVNIAEIDDQHKKLVGYINQLHEAMSEGKGKIIIVNILDSLAAYTQTHFATEERLMLAYRFPGYSTHKAEHQAFVQKVADFQAQFRSGQTTLTLQVMTFLRDWLKNHIMGTDKKYGPYLNEKGIT